jgi:outer membrane protein assembly factor BamB
VVSLLCALPVLGANWPGWRGDGSGISPEKDLPIAWSATENVLWSTPLPGEGNSSPVVWGNRIFLTASSERGKKRIVYCLDAKDGRILWQRALDAARTPPTDSKNGYASPTPVTDGTTVFVFFDSPGVAALDFTGSVLWTCDLGPFQNGHNTAISPVLWHDLVIMNCDGDKGSFIAALDKGTGRERWRTLRSFGAHYATPLIVPVNGHDQLIVSASTVVAYDPATGHEIWRCKGISPMVAPSPVAAGGLVYVTCGRDGPTMAIDPTGQGDVSETCVRMRADMGGPYVPSPLVYPYILLPGDNGAIRVLDQSGNTLLDARVQGHFTSSPVAADGRIYWPNEKGDVYVLDASDLRAKPPSLKVAAINPLGETCLASPAIADGRLYIRTAKRLFCIAGRGSVRPTIAGGAGGTVEELSERFAKHPAYAEPDVTIRIGVVEALGAMRDLGGMALLLKAAQNDDHWDVREAAAKSLVQLGEPATQALITLLTAEKSQPFSRVIAADGLGRMESVEAVPALIKESGHSDPLVCVESLRALGMIAAKHTEQLAAALRAFQAGLRSPDGSVRQAAVKALALQTAVTGDLRKRIIAALQDRTADSDSLVAQEAVQAIRAMKIENPAEKREETPQEAQPQAPVGPGEKAPLPGGSQAPTPYEPGVQERTWPRFRGPDGTGVVAADDWPRTWDVESGENILWKTPILMPGNSSPLLWGDRLFLTGAESRKQQVLCFERGSGKLLWQTAVGTTRRDFTPEDIAVSPDTGYASSTAATDGRRVFVAYASADVAAVDFNGKVAWARNLGKPESSYGRATSLLTYKNKLIVQFDRGTEPEQGLSAVLALDTDTGETVWSTPRPVRNSWSTPILVAVSGHAELIANGSPWIIAYDPENGKELWRCAGAGRDVAASPTYADGLVYVTNENDEVIAIRPGGAGDVTKTNIVWKANEGMADASSPVSDGRFLLQGNSGGRVTCHDAKTGKLFWERTLGCALWASPTIAALRPVSGDSPAREAGSALSAASSTDADRLVYFPGDDGKVYVFQLSDKAPVVATNNLGEPLWATPAFADGRIYFRGKTNLFCVGRPRRNE